MTRPIWYGILNAHGQLSELHAYLLFARSAIATRGDGMQCKLVECEVVIGREVAKTETSAKQSQGRKK